MNKSFLRKNKLIVTLSVVMVLAVSFTISAAAQMVSANIKNNSNPNSWNIKFTNMQLSTIKGTATEVTSPSYSSTYANFNVNLGQPYDKLEYEITISNQGNIDAEIDGIYVLPENTSNNPIKYQISGINVGDVLNAGDSVKAIVSIYCDNTVTVPTTRDASIFINYVQK